MFVYIYTRLHIPYIYTSYEVTSYLCKYLCMKFTGGNSHTARPEIAAMHKHNSLL